MTDIDVYQPPAGIGQYQAGIVMTPESAKALDEQVRQCTAAVLREGVDYGHIPGTNGEEKSLWRPGAQKLLQWFRLECICERVEIERDDDGRKHGITYRAEVGRGLRTAAPVILATCEGTADYDESKFCQSAEEVQRKAEANERMWARKDGRVANPNKWKDRGEYRADWNALMKRAQKRAIVGAVVDATAAGGIFSDREEDDSPAPQDDGPTWYEQALEDALTFTSEDAGRKLYVEAAQAARDGLCTPRQANHVQNRIQQRARRLKAATPVDIEDLARQAGDGETGGQEPAKASPRTARGKAAAGDDPRNQRPAGPEASGPAGARGANPAPAAAGDAPSRGAQHLPPLPGEEAADAGCNRADDEGREPPLEPGEAAEDQPGSASKDQLTRLHTILTGLGFGGEDREQKLTVAEVIAGRELTGPRRGRSSGNLSYAEAARLIARLDEFTDENGERDRAALIAYMAGREQAGDGDA